MSGLRDESLYLNCRSVNKTLPILYKMFLRNSQNDKYIFNIKSEKKNRLNGP